MSRRPTSRRSTTDDLTALLSLCDDFQTKQSTTLLRLYDNDNDDDDAYDDDVMQYSVQKMF